MHVPELKVATWKEVSLCIVTGKPSGLWIGGHMFVRMAKGHSMLLHWFLLGFLWQCHSWVHFMLDKAYFHQLLGFKGSWWWRKTNASAACFDIIARFVWVPVDGHLIWFNWYLSSHVGLLTIVSTLILHNIRDLEDKYMVYRRHGTNLFATQLC